MKSVALLALLFLLTTCASPDSGGAAEQGPPNVLLIVAQATGITLSDSTLDGRLLSEPDSDRLLVWKWQKTWAARRGDYKVTNSNENHWKSEPSAQYIAPVSDSLNLKLFNVELDPGERNDLATEMPEKVREMETAYLAWCATNLEKY